MGMALSEHVCVEADFRNMLNSELRNKGMLHVE